MLDNQQTSEELINSFQLALSGTSSNQLPAQSDDKQSLKQKNVWMISRN